MKTHLTRPALPTHDSGPYRKKSKLLSHFEIQYLTPIMQRKVYFDSVFRAFNPQLAGSKARRAWWECLAEKAAHFMAEEAEEAARNPCGRHTFQVMRC